MARRRTDPMADLASMTHRYEAERHARREAEHRADRAERRTRSLARQLDFAKAAHAALVAELTNTPRPGEPSPPRPAFSGRRHGPESAG